MRRKFVMMPIFDKQWKSMGLTDDDLQKLQEQLLKKSAAWGCYSGYGRAQENEVCSPRQREKRQLPCIIY